MAMSMNKVFISGRLKGDPYQIPGRHRTISRFLVYLPRERNRRSDADTVLVEAAGRNAVRIMQSLKEGSFVTLEGRLRSGIIMRGEERHEVLLVRLENFAINIAPAPGEEDEGGEGGEGGEERKPRKPRKPRGKGRRGEGKPERAPEAAGGSALASAETDAPAPVAVEAAPAPVVEAPKAPPIEPDAPPPMPEIKPAKKAALEGDMPF